MDAIFPYIESLTVEEKKAQSTQLDNDISAINAAKFSSESERALDEAQRVAAAEVERARTAESKATTYLAVLAALVPLVITLQAATWEDKSGPAPETLKLVVLFIATIYVAAAGYHAFRTLQVSGFHRVMESDIAAAWRSPSPLQRLAKSTLLASRMSRDAVNAKVTRIKATHQHLVRAFGAFVLLLSLDPIFYSLGAIGENLEIRTPMNAEQVRELLDGDPQASSTSPLPDDGPSEPNQSSERERMLQVISRPENAQTVDEDGTE
ncbi:MAG: hypothetical protein ACK4LQ_02855 [Pararhodobacter sp.]